MRLRDIEEAIKKGKAVFLYHHSPPSGAPIGMLIASLRTFVKHIEDKEVREALTKYAKSDRVLALGMCSENERGITTNLLPDFISLPDTTLDITQLVVNAERFRIFVPESNVMRVDVDDVWEEVKKKFHLTVSPDLGFSKIVLIALILRHLIKRYTVPHDAIKLAIWGKNRTDEDLPISLLENGKCVRVNYYLGEEEKKPLNTYHLIALFDLLLYMVHIGEIERHFAIAKSNREHRKGVITTELIRDTLNVSNYEARKVRKAIYDLSKLVIVFETKDGTKVGIFPIRRVGFKEKKEDRLDVFEIDHLFLRNGKYFVPLLSHTFVRLCRALPNKSRELGSNVLLYLIKTRNFRTHKSYISARSFSREFPNSYAEQRKWAELTRVLREILQGFQQKGLIRGFAERDGHFEVELHF